MSSLPFVCGHTRLHKKWRTRAFVWQCLAQSATPYHDSEGCRSFTNLFKDQMCTWHFIWSEEANSCDLSMPGLWNSSLLMLYGKRNLFLLDCTSDSWPMTLSLRVSGAETKSRTGFLPNLFRVCTWRCRWLLSQT